MASGPKPSNLQAHAEVFVDGQDMTAQWDSRLIELTIIDPENGFNECIIELDDSVSGSWSGGQPSGWLGLPRLGSRVQVVLGWQKEGAPTVFQGWVWDIEQSGQRRAGRRLRVECKSGKGTGKVPMTKYWGADKEKTTGGGGFDDDGVSLKTVLEEAAKAAGYTINVHSSLAEIKERYWVQNSESFHQLGWRLSGQYKALFKVAGDVA